MAGKIDWENQIGRRLRFRDLHVFFTVVRHGSMAKAAVELGVAASDGVGSHCRSGARSRRTIA